MVVEVGSLHPNQPGWLQDSEVDDERLTDDVVVDRVSEGAGTAEVVEVVVVVGSLQPNQPGVLQVVVVVVDLEVLVLVAVVVVVSSRQPHQPGVLQVVVLVFVVDVEVEVYELDVVVRELLLSKYFQRKQSLHSSSGTHSGTVLYFFNTLSITIRILWLPIPTRQPKSPTVS